MRLSKVLIRFLLLGLAVFSGLICSKAQSKVDKSLQQGTCRSDAFDKKVRQMISFTVPTIDVDSLRNFQGEVYIFDAREMEEYQVSHIEGAQHIGFNNFDLNNLKTIPNDSKIVVYCSIGYRSERIGQLLQDAGFQQVYNLYGSIFEWVNRGYPVVNGDNQTTDEVHTYNKSWSRWVENDRVKKIW